MAVRVSQVTGRRGLLIAVAVGLLTLLLIGGPLIGRGVAGAGDDGGDLGVEFSLEPTVASAIGSLSVEAPPSRPVFESSEVPTGFVLERSELVEGFDGGHDKTYLAYVRGTDPDLDPSFGVLRVRVVYGSTFDAAVWLKQYADAEAVEGPGAREWSKTTVRGKDGILESPRTEQGHTVLRWGERDDIQIIVSGTATVSEADLRLVAENLAEVAR